MVDGMLSYPTDIMKHGAAWFDSLSFLSLNYVGVVVLISETCCLDDAKLHYTIGIIYHHCFLK